MNKTTELECRFWAIPLACGTKYIQYPTTLHDLKQFIAVFESVIYDSRDYIPPAMGNIMGLVGSFATQYKAYASFDETCDYCNLLQPTYDMTDSEKQTFARQWQWEFDLAIHDAAVSYTYLAAELSGNDAKQAARIACELWFYSRQLRKDMAVYECQKANS